MSYLQKYLFKPVFLVFTVVILLAVVINIFLVAPKTEIEPLLNKYFNQRLSVESIYYFPPNFIVLKNFSIRKAPPSGAPLFVIDKATFVFSLRDLIARRRFTITRIYLNRSRIIATEDAFFPEKSFEQAIRATLKSLAKARSLEVTIENALLIVARKENFTSRIPVNATLKIEYGLLSSFGSVSLENLFLNYNFRGSLIEEGIAIENLEFKIANFCSKLWGTLERNVLRLNGSAGIGDSYIFYYLHESPATIIDRFKKIIGLQRRPIAQIIEPSAPALDIPSLDCVIKFVSRRIQIENLSFPLNKNFVQAKGYLEKGKFNGKISFAFSKKMKGAIPVEKIGAAFENLTFYSIGTQRRKVSSEEIILSLATDANSYQVFLKDFNALLNLRDRRVKSVKFDSIVYDGSLEGKGLIETGRTMPPKCSFDLKIKDVSLDRLESLLSYSQKVKGKLASQIYYRSHPRPNLKGKLLISDGYVDDLEFFKWLAGFFKIPSLKKVDFDGLSLNFLVNSKAASLNNISLDSKEIKLDGDFSLREDNLVSGKLSLGLCEEMLMKSPRFKALLRILDEYIDQVAFDFQVSGLVDSMNFKWLESDFKRKILELVPPSKQKKIQKNIEEILKPAP